MTNAGVRLYHDASHRLTIELGGELDEPLALYCECEVRVDLAQAASRSLCVLWDLSAVTGYSLEARLVLARLQQFLAGKALCTAYVAPAAATRSLALWAARMGEQVDACIAADRPAAEAWLAAAQLKRGGVPQQSSVAADDLACACERRTG
jgi:hypothetical protein